MRIPVLSLLFACLSQAQVAPYDNAPEVEPPYFRVRYPASDQAGDLKYPVQYTVWIPSGVETLRGVVVHQHGCGEGSCLSGQTGAFDLHWQALARKHDCALLSPSYEQPDGQDCQLWCDPRNGSADSFQQALSDLGKLSGHPELSSVPWALWGHSGGGHWAGGMSFLFPERVVAAWLRSGVPYLEANPERPGIKPYPVNPITLGVPLMCNLGTKEGVSVKDGRFSGVWPSNETFFLKLRSRGGLVGVAVDPLTSHECGNQRYLAIPWLDHCLGTRLPDREEESLKAMPRNGTWLAEPLGTRAVAKDRFAGDSSVAAWLPNERLARLWEHYVRNTEVPDVTPPPSPSAVRFEKGVLEWSAAADVESGLAHFVIYSGSKRVARVPAEPKNRFGRPIFQGLQYSDTPLRSLPRMRYEIPSNSGVSGPFRVTAVNTVGLESR